MDGVLCNFDKAYRSLRTHAADGKRFRAAVMEFQIFEDLEFMPDTQELLTYVSALDDIKIEILTSLGTFDVLQGNAAKYQKMKWLDSKNIPYKANFVRSKEEKSKFAHDRAILVDDSIGCITPFTAKGGHGILHVKSSDTIQQIHDTIRGIRGLYALKADYA
jgi:2-polyprenyl-6-methoxyphenol hydroxylase-like FAD-dependent oxidoreductase